MKERRDNVPTLTLELESTSPPIPAIDCRFALLEGVERPFILARPSGIDGARGRGGKHAERREEGEHWEKGLRKGWMRSGRAGVAKAKKRSNGEEKGEPEAGMGPCRPPIQESQRATVQPS